MNPSANVFIFGDFILVELKDDLTQVVNFPTRIPDCDSHNPALLDLCFSSDASICSSMAFSPL